MIVTVPSASGASPKELATDLIVMRVCDILLAFPGARIYSFDSAPPEPVAYADLEHVRLTRDFLNAPERYLRALRENPPADMPQPLKIRVTSRA